jgi:formate dehydrogenase iron-sulfur subunit
MSADKPIRVFVPIDAAALSVGAEAVAKAIASEAQARELSIELVRNGTRGMLWLEPMVEVETPQGRIAFGPVAAKDVVGLFDAGFLSGGKHTLALGPTEELDWMKRQQRVTFARIGVTDPLSLAEYQAHGGLAGLKAALGMTGTAVVEAVKASGLRGRGGAGFPTGIKWKTVADAQGRAQIHRLQCRRGRQRHLRRPHDHGRRSLRADRGHDDRRHRGRRDQGLHLYPLGISACHRR